MITLINGFVQNQSGMAVPDGSISFQLNVDATIVATPFGIIPADQIVVFQFDATGNILPNSPAATAQIYSNQELQPQNANGLGTYYLVTFYDANGARINKSPMWWQFPDAANATVDISRMQPFATIGGNIIFYPTNFTIGPPGISTLGGIFSNIGIIHEWVRSINTDGTVGLSQPAFSDISGTISPSQLPGGFAGWNTVVKTGTYVAVAGDMVLADTSGGGFTVTLPLSSTNKNLSIRVKKISSDSNTVTVARSGADAIDGQTSQTFNSQYTDLEAIADGGVNWWIA
jgi:hypothetical protein